MDQNSKVKLHTGNYMPVMGLGTWQLTKDTKENIQHAIEIGYQLIDTSSDYGTQPGIRQAIKDSGVSREQLYITTKIEETDDAYERTKSNLKELGLDFVEQELIHRPPTIGSGLELWKGLIRAKEEGLVQDIGVSNYSIPLIENLIKETKIVPTINQIEWSPFGYSEEMLNYCRENMIIIQAYSPLTRAERLNNGTLNEIAERYGKSPAQILIRWNLQIETVPIPKANQKKHQEENLDVFDFEINEHDLKTLNGLNEYYSSLGSLPYI